MVGMGVGVAVGMALLVGAVVTVGTGVALGAGVVVGAEVGAQADNIKANRKNKIHVRFIIRDIPSTGSVSHRFTSHNLAPYRLS
jgi:tetrahydrodipicolinate N-succinyltransferase